MGDDPDIEAGLAAIADFIDRSERTVIDEINTTNDEGTPVKGYAFTHGDDQLFAYSTAGSHFFTVQYEYDVTEQVAFADKAQQKLNKAPETVDGEIEVNVDLDENDLQRAQQKVAAINGDRNPETLEKARSKLVEMLTHPDCAFKLNQRLNGPHGFKLQKKLFVYESGVRASDFDAACQTLVSLSMVPQNFLQSIYDIQIEPPGSGTEESTGPQVPGSRGFQ
ncbi:hypothetical protein [Haloarcula pellucida]|uniref:Uncharacterized protein n=1 Tax=Haloarcula pellucida TaxID=1427151 RepID=A0A830GH43_9EURY|nr:hypothetical protein [Halomicroarcula pellucida]MBX0346585.1 hypothetical protein [Halomicroarcula pellucida]GGN84411.1 hypothetical protein GCM10009030_00030 [Halomicroarcula pellucida]